MAKHLVGFGLFASIVGFFVLAYSILTLPPIPSLDPEVSPLAKLPTHCNFGPVNRIGKTRAFADRRSGEVTLYINSVSADRETFAPEIKARFTFFVVRDGSARIADSIDDSLVVSVDRDNDTKWILRYKADWVTELSPNDTVYIVPGLAEGQPVTFSKDNALAVLIRN